MKLFGPYDIKVWVRRYIESLPDLEGKVVVDVPAGTGVMSGVFRDRGASVEAYDLFPQFFEIDGVECRRADLSEILPVPAAHADYVLCQEGIEHLPDQLHALREFNRVLKPGGRVVLTTPNVSNLRARLSHFLVESDLYNRMPPNELDSIWFSGGSERDLYFGHVFLSGVQKLRILARIAGFDLERIHPVKASRSSLLLGVFLPLLVVFNLYAYSASLRRHRHLDPARTKEVLGEILRVNLNPNVLFGKHLFVELVKRHELDEVGPLFHNKLTAESDPVEMDQDRRE